MLRARASTIRRHGGGGFGREAFRVGRSPAGDLSALAGERSLFGESAAEKLARLQAELEPLSRRYDVVVANPPYMGSSSLGIWMGKWVKDEHPDAYRDLCTSFIERGFTMSSSDGFSAMVTMQSWMFLGSFEKLRGMILRNHSIATMAHLGTRAFSAIGGEVVSTTATVFGNAKSGVPGAYFRLVDMGSENEKKAGLLEALANPECGWFYRAAGSQFKSIPGSPVVYWLCEQLIDAFAKYPPLASYACPKKGLGTGNKKQFMRYWWEVSNANTSFDCGSRTEALASCKRWFSHNKGGPFRKWYGNNDYVVDWLDDGAGIKSYRNTLGQLGARPQNQDYYFKACITWSKISSGRLAFRFKGAGSIFNEVAPALFSDEETMMKLEAFLNSSVCLEIARAISPTLDFQVGQVATYPVAPDVLKTDGTAGLARVNTEISRIDWNAFEESWNFAKHPLI